MGDGSGFENRRGESPWGFDSLSSRLAKVAIYLLGGRLMVGCLTLNQAIKVRLLPSQPFGITCSDQRLEVIRFRFNLQSLISNLKPASLA